MLCRCLRDEPMGSCGFDYERRPTVLGVTVNPGPSRRLLEEGSAQMGGRHVATTSEQLEKAAEVLAELEERQLLR